MGLLENLVSSLKRDQASKLKLSHKEENALSEIEKLKDMKDFKALIQKINSLEVLEALSDASRQDDPKVSQLILDRRNTICFQKVLSSNIFDEETSSSLDKITQNEKLVKIILEKDFGPLREKAIQKIREEKELIKLARKINSPKWGKVVINRIADIDSLKSLSQNASHKKVKTYAKERIEELLNQNDQEGPKLALLAEKIEAFLKHYSETKATLFLQDFKKSFFDEMKHFDETPPISITIQQKIEIIEKRIQEKINAEESLQKAKDLVKTYELKLQSGDKITEGQSHEFQSLWDELDWASVSLKEREDLSKKFFLLLEKLTDKDLEKRLHAKEKSLEKIEALLESLEKLVETKGQNIIAKWRHFEKEWEFQKNKIEIPKSLSERKSKIQNIVQEQKKKFSESTSKSRPKEGRLDPKDLLKKLKKLVKNPNHRGVQKEVNSIKRQWEHLLKNSESLVRPFVNEFESLAEQFIENQSQFRKEKDWENWSNDRKRQEVFNDLKKTMDQGIIKSLGSKIKEYQKEWNGLKVKGDTELEKTFLKLIDEAKNKCLEAKKSTYEKLKLILPELGPLTETFIKEKSEEVKSIQREFSLIGPLPKGIGEELTQDFQNTCQHFFDQRKDFNNQKDEKRQENYRIKKEICEDAKALINSNENESIKKVIALQKKWKTIGPVPTDKKDKLWEDFQNACHEFFNNLDKEKAGNQEKKEALCQKMENIVSELNEDTHFKDVAQKVKKLQQEWKQIGPIPKTTDEILWKKFRGNCDVFFESRDKFLEERKDQYAKNEVLKRALLNECDKIYQDNSWKERTEKVLEIQKNWKEIGPAPKSVEKELWKEFKLYCDDFFSKKKDYFNTQLEEKKEHLKIKKDICIQLEALAKLSLEDTNLEIVNDSIDVAKQLDWGLRLKSEIVIPGDPPQTKRKAI
ncbi:MAG: DUF349 domain-containing protein, partial [Bdellovibrionota bacterium]|nr:DUF349 domain-containing protein [Bdellovibrionota bacterium]